MQNGFNREGEGGHDPREDVDGLTWKNHSQMNILEAFCNVFSHLRKGSDLNLFLVLFWNIRLDLTQNIEKNRWFQ